MNLNKLTIRKEIDDSVDQKMIDNSIVKNNIHVHFKNLEHILIKYISEADAIIGCTAWLTNKNILKAFNNVKHGISIIVQKEDFLRPDSGNMSNIKELYNNNKGLTWHEWGNTHFLGIKQELDPKMLNFASHLPEYEYPIRCMGNHNRDKSPAFPRMHNKFIVFGKMVNNKNEFGISKDFRPYAVWTGSFNFSHNSVNSMENAIYIKDTEIATSYMNEWAQILALSESLDWSSEWCAPQFRIGT